MRKSKGFGVKFDPVIHLTKLDVTNNVVDAFEADVIDRFDITSFVTG